MNSLVTTNDPNQVVKEEIDISDTVMQEQLLEAALKQDTVNVDVTSESNRTREAKPDLTQHNEARARQIAISFPCPKCLMRFGNRKLSQSHMRKIHSDTLRRLETCPICLRTFRYKSVLFVHLNNHREKACPICNVVVQDSGALKNHVESLHIGKLEFVCPICFKLSIDSASHDGHVSSHYGRRRYECVDCSKYYASLEGLERHRQTHIGTRLYKCDQCPDFFSIQQALQGHRKTHLSLPTKIIERKYKCSYCLKFYSSRQDLRSHINTHTGARPFKCNECPKNYFSPQGLLKHRQRHLSGGGSVKCSVCSQILKHSRSLRIHMKTHTDERPYQCDQCPNNYASQEALQNHRKTHKALPSKINESYYKCSYCLKTYTNKYDLRTHINTHTGTRPFKCGQCPKSFVGPRALRNHRLRHLPEGSPVKCSICSKTLSDSKSLSFHMNIHTGARPFHCDQCANSFATPWALTNHRSGHLLGASHLKCSICSKTLSSSKNLRFHMNTHSGTRPYKCDQCPKNFASLQSLYKHGKRHSRSDKFEYKCYVCSDMFTEQRSLNLHLNTHNDVYFKCQQCEKTYASRGCLARHHRKNPSHGGYEYKCSICSKGFFFERSLNNHMKTHFEAPPYKCDECPKGFYSTSGLAQHRRIHLTDAENLHKCPVCYETFTLQQSLVAHMNTHPGLRPYKCDQCPKGYASRSALKVHLKKHLIKPGECKEDRSDKSLHDEAKDGDLDKIADAHTALAKYKCKECDKVFISERNLSFHLRQHV